jgi:hypothetical protein
MPAGASASSTPRRMLHCHHGAAGDQEPAGINSFRLDAPMTPPREGSSGASGDEQLMRPVGLQGPPEARDRGGRP